MVPDFKMLNHLDYISINSWNMSTSHSILILNTTRLTKGTQAYACCEIRLFNITYSKEYVYSDDNSSLKEKIIYHYEEKLKQLFKTYID